MGKFSGEFGVGAQADFTPAPAAGKQGVDSRRFVEAFFLQSASPKRR
jgi:hypothetical protein